MPNYDFVELIIRLMGVDPDPSSQTVGLIKMSLVGKSRQKTGFASDKMDLTESQFNKLLHYQHLFLDVHLEIKLDCLKFGLITCNPFIFYFRFYFRIVYVNSDINALAKLVNTTV